MLNIVLNQMFKAVLPAMKTIPYASATTRWP